MNRKHLFSILAAGALGVLVAQPVSAQGLITFRNTTYSDPVLVEVRLGDTLDTAGLYGTQKIAKNASWEVDSGGVLIWWRREATPGANDGKFTDWQRVNAATSDERVTI